MVKAPLTIVICTLGRPVEYANLIRSINAQTYQPKKVITITERGPLAALRNQGLRAAATECVSFVDDDVLLPRGWVQGVWSTLTGDSITGCTGPAIVPISFMENRDLFKYRHLRYLYDRLFLSDVAGTPGSISKAGAFWPTAEGCNYDGEVTFLEACNMSYKTKALQRIGGFDETYGGVGEWSEPDACFRLRDSGAKLVFTIRAALQHCPSQQGAYVLRAAARSRMDNYNLFSRRWIRPCWQHQLYKSFYRGYLTWKTLSSAH